MWANTWQSVFQILPVLKCSKNTSRCFGRIQAPQNCPVSCGIPSCQCYIPHMWSSSTVNVRARHNKPVQVVTEEPIKSVYLVAFLLFKTCY